MNQKIESKIFLCKIFEISEAPPEVFCKKKVFLKILRNSQENVCARVSFLIKLQS